MINKILATSVLSALMATSFSANADIQYTLDKRFVYWDGPSGPVTKTPTPAFSDFVADAWAYEAGSYQDSTLTSSYMSGYGDTYAGPDAAFNYGATAQSEFSVTFNVDELNDFSLTGYLDYQYAAPGEVAVTLKENGTNIFYTDSLGDFIFDGQFVVGAEYQLIATSYTAFSDYYYEAWQFDLTTSPVPVPAAVWLFGSGLLGLIGAARRRKKCV